MGLARMMRVIFAPEGPRRSMADDLAAEMDDALASLSRATHSQREAVRHLLEDTLAPHRKNGAGHDADRS